MSSDSHPWVELFFLVLVFPLWLAGMVAFVHFTLRVVPSALRRWADAEGYHIIQRKKAGFLDWWSYAKGSGHWIYRVIVRDKAGQRREGLVRVGHPSRFCISVSRCPVEVRWKKIEPDSPAISSQSHKDPLWDRELD